MAKRKLKRWVKVTMLLGGMAFMGGMLTQVGNEPHAQAVQVEKKEYSYMEKLEMNEKIGVDAQKENMYHYKAFYLYEDKENYVFMEEVTMDKLYVKKSVLKQSYIDKLQIGERVTLHSDSNRVKAVELESGYSVVMQPLMLEGEGVAGVKYVGEDKKVYSVDKDFKNNFNLAGSTIGSVATGYFYENKLVAIRKGW